MTDEEILYKAAEILRSNKEPSLAGFVGQVGDNLRIKREKAVFRDKVIADYQNALNTLMGVCTAYDRTDLIRERLLCFQRVRKVYEALEDTPA